MARLMEDQSSIEMNDEKETLEQDFYIWADITQEFFEAITELELGELLHDELFGLFDAMAAIEMMDPKMDAGMLCNRGNNKPYTFAQAASTGVIKLDGLTPAEIIGIIDSTYACIVSWLEGHSLAQTVFTNLYLHQPDQIIDKTLQTFCYAVYKIIEEIRECIVKASVYEEEDFQSVMYGIYKLQADITEQTTISMLREVEEELHRKSRIKPVDDEKEREYNDGLALYARIRFTKMFYQVLTLMGRKEQLTQNLTGCQRFLSNCSDMIQVMIKTVNRGAKADEITNHPNVMGFDPMINQRLLPPTFPRYTKIKPRIEALEYMDELINRFKTVTKITSYTSFHGALDFFLEFSRQSPCILSRSMLQIVYLFNRVFVTDNFADLLKDAARNFIAPPALMPRSTLLQSHQAKECVDNFLAHCANFFSTLLQTTGHNRARQRDRLAYLFDNFAALQDEAERVDSYMHALSLKSDTPRPHLACFGTWILYHTLRVMVMYLLSGFELELYSVHEYHYIFWYLYEFLYGWLVSAITRADSFIMEQDMQNESRAINQKGRSSKKSAKNKKKKVTPRPFHLEILMYQAMQNICGGFYKALVGFRMDGRIPLPESQFDCERVRYEHRLLPFSSLITPPPVPYKKFIEMTNAQMSRSSEKNTSVSQYFDGCRHFHQAKNMLDRALELNPSNPNTVNEINDLLKVVKTNFIVLKLLNGGHKIDSKEPPVFDFKCHPHFPIIKLT
ncbi:hypothetical protein TSAR_013448 [Trichomalopsis sarcophagae]|uniref:Protein MAK10 homolog n=1 Tax=Trichomalopsis sarcophagae TaxID=543379 RepID=A0A232F3E9_9HYME|nr:hypothetical protein TSAR_013448 [Trichomalopsis sarcophagae]